MASYVTEIKSIDKELVRIRENTKRLTSQKETAKQRLYEYMSAHHLSELDGIKIESIAPKNKKKRKPAAQKKAEAMKILYDAGLVDAESIYNNIIKAQKNQEPQESFVFSY